MYLSPYQSLHLLLHLRLDAPLHLSLYQSSTSGFHGSYLHCSVTGRPDLMMARASTTGESASTTDDCCSTSLTMTHPVHMSMRMSTHSLCICPDTCLTTCLHTMCRSNGSDAPVCPGDLQWSRLSPALEPETDVLCVCVPVHIGISTFSTSPSEHSERSHPSG